MAEIEIGVLARQCLDRRIANQDILRGEVNAWQNQRNRDVIRVDWRFTTEDARIKLKSLYLEIHYTPKHGSWLNMAEIEIGVLARQCLDRRIANQDILRGEVNAWQNQRNRDVIRVDWRFTTEDARIKLKSLYPSIQKR